MPRFEFKARNQEGEKETGQICAPTEEEVKQVLMARGYYPLEIEFVDDYDPLQKVDEHAPQPLPPPKIPREDENEIEIRMFTTVLWKRVAGAVTAAALILFGLWAASAAVEVFMPRAGEKQSTVSGLVWLAFAVGALAMPLVIFFQVFHCLRPNRQKRTLYAGPSVNLPIPRGGKGIVPQWMSARTFDISDDDFISVQPTSPLSENPTNRLVLTQGDTEHVLGLVDSGTLAREMVKRTSAFLGIPYLEPKGGRTFRYVAKDQNRKTVRGQIVAVDAETVNRILTEMGYEVVKIEETD
jgi:hypothetical protein